ncbi:hypothetical protein [Actinomycetospora flava]|uniref:Uncharacterized protein n=1 Tax=Actinomycetospora flava TaxID=3129232 RepID=A0ABU8M8M0_9PSEU
MVGVLVAVAAVSGLTGGLIAVTMAPQTTPAFTPSTSLVEVDPPAVATPAPAATRPATPARVEEATTITRPSTSGRSRASSNNAQSEATETVADDTDDEDRASSSGASTRSSRGDGCRPYEHKLTTGYCSPDTDVLDENGNPDPARAVVPGNPR